MNAKAAMSSETPPAARSGASSCLKYLAEHQHGCPNATSRSSTKKLFPLMRLPQASRQSPSKWRILDRVAGW
jgi:hypothetical protein